MEPFEVMVSESQERMLCVVEPANSTRCSRCVRSGRSAARRSAASPTPVACACSPAQQLVGDMPVRALVDDCPLYDLRPQKPSQACLPGADGDAFRADDARADAARAAGSPNIASRRALFEQYDAIVQSRTVRRPEQADAAVLALADGSALAVSIDCNGRRVAADPYRGHRGDGARVRGQPRVRRRRAARHDQQPQLRQPREAAHRLAAHRSRARPRRRLPRARGADRRRQRVAVQRGRHRPDLSRRR